MLLKRLPIPYRPTTVFLNSLYWIFILSHYVLSQTITYPHHFVFTGNPLVRTTGASDPSVHVWDGKVWMYTSKDHAPGYSAMDGYNVFSSADLIHWTDHGEIFNSTMLNKASWGETQKGWMWAPGAARKKNNQGNWVYYLYYPHNKAPQGSGENWVTGVATAPNPWGPFTDIGILGGYPERVAAMDPMVFIDDDGQAYIYANSAKVAKLNPDMISLAETPKDIEYALGRTDVKNNQGRKFGEGSYMHKKDGIYYYSYSNFEGENDMQGFYATGTNPYGPFTWKGPMAPRPKGAQDHHSIIDFNGQWYYFYHIAVNNYPLIRDGQSRIACFDLLFHGENQTIRPVVQTLGILTGISSKTPFKSNTLLQQNFPNPFRLNTTIRYSLPSKSWLKLIIRNTSGQVVKTLVNRIQEPGSYSVQWDGTNQAGKKVTQGLYLYTLESEKFSETKKLSVTY